MSIIRGFLATLAFAVLMAACTNPFAPDDIGNTPEGERGSGDQDQGQALAPAPPPAYFL